MLAGTLVQGGGENRHVHEEHRLWENGLTVENVTCERCENMFCGAKYTLGNPSLNCLVPRGAAVSKWLPESPQRKVAFVSFLL